MARKTGSGMTIHRAASRSSRNRPAPIDAGAVITVVQVCFCILSLVTLFTLQFINREQYDRAGELYKMVMQGGEGEAVFVGAFGKPITGDSISRYAAELWEQLEALPLHQPQLQPAGQGGGETPYIPSNTYLGSVALMAAPDYPVYGSVTSGFGLRSHPISEKTDFHTGLDIAAPAGESIYAVLPGRVIQVGYSETNGNFIRLAHGSNLETVYSHCHSILATTGTVVRSGERIALVGSTGISTGPHLHLELLVDGRYTDPLPIFRL